MEWRRNSNGSRKNGLTGATSSNNSNHMETCSAISLASDESNITISQQNFKTFETYGDSEQGQENSQHSTGSDIEMDNTSVGENEDRDYK